MSVEVDERGGWLTLSADEFPGMGGPMFMGADFDRARAGFYERGLLSREGVVWFIELDENGYIPRRMSGV